MGIATIDSTQNIRTESNIGAFDFFNNFPEPTLLLDNNGAIKTFNNKTREVLGLKPDEIVGVNILTILVRNGSRDNRVTLPSGSSKKEIVSFKSNPNNNSLFELTYFKGDGDTMYVVARDVTQDQKEKNELIEKSYRDEFTGLYNKDFFKEEVKRLNERKSTVSVVIVDANLMKVVNDDFGHDAGDRLIQQIAEVLKRACRSSDIVGRIGGDEFGFLLPDTDEDGTKIIIDRIQTECRKLQVNEVPMFLAIGSATRVNSDRDINELIREADDNMYVDKRKQKYKLI